MSDRTELEELRRLDELEAKAGGRALPTATKGVQLSTPIWGADRTLDQEREAQAREQMVQEMPGGQRFAAAYGGVMPGMYMGAKQALNIGDQGELQKEIDETKRLKAPLLKTPEGMGGDVAGNMATMSIAAPIPGVNTLLGGAALGGISGALQPTASDENAGAQIGGGMLAGAFGSALANALPSAVKGIVSPFFEGGQKKIAADTLRRFGGGGPMTAQAAKTPGWQPTLAEATGNPGLATLQRGVSSKSPEVAAALHERQLSQNQAVADALQKIAGGTDEQSMARGVRDYMSSGYYQQAADEGLKAPSPKMAEEIATFIERPSMKKAISKAKDIFGERELDLSGQGSVRGLQLTKQALDDIIGKAGSHASSIGKNELRALQDTRSDLIDMIQELSPKQRMADVNYATFSRPVNEQKIGQYLADKLQPAITDFQPGAPTRLTPNAYAQALRGKDDLARKATGYAGARFDDIMSGGAQQSIQGVGEDLARRGAAQTAAIGVGPTTSQNLASQQLLGRIAGPIGMPQSWADAIASSTLGKSVMRPAQWAAQIPEQKIQEQLSRALLDPAYAQQLMQSGSPTIKNEMLRRALANALTVGSVGAANSGQ
jgi:cell pole-organizing protein PopZ